MHNPFDRLAKKVGKQALEASGRTEVHYEIARDAQYADIRHDPDPARAAERERLGLLGRMAAVLCLIEVFAHAPEGAELRACLSKHFAHWEECVRRALKLNKRREAKGLPPEPIVEPMLWIVVATISAPVMRKLKVDRAAGWPAGVYFLGADLYRTGIVVADELPRDRSTILVRIMAAGRGLSDAITDLSGLPADAVERAVAEDVLLHLQHALGKKPSMSPEEEEFVVTMQGNWEYARKVGELAARAESVLAVLRVRRIAVTEADRERILAETNPERLQRWLDRAVVAASVAEVFRARKRAACTLATRRRRSSIRRSGLFHVVGTSNRWRRWLPLRWDFRQRETPTTNTATARR